MVQSNAQSSQIGPPPQVFISYASRDKRYWDELEPHLTRLHNIELWTPASLKPGFSTEQQTQDAMDRSCIAVVLMSPNYYASPPKRKELHNLLKDKGRRILPVIIQPVDGLPKRFQKLHPINQNNLPIDGLPLRDREHNWMAVRQAILNSVPCPERLRWPPHPIVSAIFILAAVLGMARLRAEGDTASSGDKKKLQPPQTAGHTGTSQTDIAQKPAAPASRTPPFVYCCGTITPWLRFEAEQFKAKNSGAQVQFTEYGSRQGKQEILYPPTVSSSGPKGARIVQSESTPLLYCPAAAYWTDKLNIDWLAQHKGASIVAAPQPVVSTQLVLVMTQKSRDAFLLARDQAAHTGNHPEVDPTWNALHNLVEQGWHIDIADPTQAHSGFAALALMFEAFRKEHPRIDSKSDSFVQFMRTLAQHTGGRFVDTGKLVADFAQNPRHQTIVIGYEANVFQALHANAEADMTVIYPQDTLDITFQVATLVTSVSRTEKPVADAFAAYLMEPEIQKQALLFGMRPATVLPEEIERNFHAPPYSKAGFDTKPRTVLPLPEADVLEDLPYRWALGYNEAHRQTPSDTIPISIPHGRGIGR